MAKITKKTTADAGPRATVAKLEDARTLLTTIRQSLDGEILKRADDVGKPGVGWTHFGTLPTVSRNVLVRILQQS